MSNNYEHFESWDSLIDAIIKWGEDHGIDNPQTQALKWCEEVGETIGEINHERLGADYRDGHGDSLVSQIILAHITGVSLFKSLEEAYNVIKNRKGMTHNGNFIKSEDLDGRSG